MRLSLQLEQFLFQAKSTTVRLLARHFRVSEERCREELDSLRPFGVDISESGWVRAPSAPVRVETARDWG